MSLELVERAPPGYFEAIDRELARALARLVSERDPLVLLGVALASRHVREGHVAVDLARVAGSRLGGDGAGSPLKLPLVDPWLSALSASKLVGDGKSATPLVLDSSGRLYLHRYYMHERALAEELARRARPAAVAGRGFADALARWFGPRSAEPDAQRTAAMLAILSPLTVIYGGPGTGKTTTVARLLGVLHQVAERPPRTLLLAPTGKAAARLSESMTRAFASLDAPAGVAALPTQASTIHRALGTHGSDVTRTARNREHPLASDVVVVDEVSMVDVALMRRLLEAVPPEARVVLLGDAHQLASVEAGAVLGDICGRARGYSYSADASARAEALFGEGLPGAGQGPAHPLRDSMVELGKSHRFDPNSALGALALRVNAGDGPGALRALAESGSELSLRELAGDALEVELARSAVGGFAPMFAAKDPVVALAELARFRILAAHRNGPRGVTGLCRAVEQALVEARLLPSNALEARFYPGRPLMITENDYQLGLYNGDVGIVWRTAAGALAVHFSSGDGETRALSPSRLPPHETVYATSIHKSQGSEHDEVVVVLPTGDSPLLTRELLYTALTRARRRVTVYGSREAVARAVERRVERDSGLADLLWQPGTGAQG